MSAFDCCESDVRGGGVVHALDCKRISRAERIGVMATDVYEFHEKFGMLHSSHPRHLTTQKLNERVACIQEELDELVQACGLQPHNLQAQNLANQADALVDLVYFALGTAVMLGLPWQELWDDVHRANMAKVRGIGPRGHQVDCIKPPGWVGPKTLAILEAYGYNEDVDRRVENHVDDPGTKP